MSDPYDVIVVGGGIAGCSLAARLARDGVRVLVLEKTIEYVDRVRGEAMMPWGVAELKRLGLYETLISAGAIHTDRWIQYEEGRSREESEANPIPVGRVLPDAAPLNIGHPTACAALAEAAVAAGAEVARGVIDPQLQREPLGVTFSTNGKTRRERCRLIVGADGRHSVIREQAHIPMQRQDPPHMISGLLVEPAEPLPEHDVIAVEGDMALLYFVQPQGLARIYAGPSVEERDRFTGRDGPSKLLEAVRLDCLPTADALADGKPAGPCATYPGDDSWTDTPFAEGAVLIGDAAGHNNPNIGQGLSLAMRDVRIVSDVLLSINDWSPAAFREYGDERTERMRRVRFNANLFAETFFSSSSPEARRERQMRRVSDPVLLQGLLSALTGPETAPSEAFTEEAFRSVIAPN